MTDDAQPTDATLEYGDQFKHVITGEVKTVHDVREGCDKVLWAEGGFATSWWGRLSTASPHCTSRTTVATTGSDPRRRTAVRLRGQAGIGSSAHGIISFVRMDKTFRKTGYSSSR